MDIDGVKLPIVHSYSEIFNLIPIENPFYLFFWLVCTVGILWILHRNIVQREGLKIQFYITDFWAAILALAPSFFLLPEVLNEADDLRRMRLIGLFVLTFLSTLAGIRAWLILALPKRDEPLPARWGHFVSVLGGGLAGFFGVFVSVIAFAIVSFLIVLAPTAAYYALYSWVNLCIVMPPLVLITIVCFWIVKRTFEQLKR